MKATRYLLIAALLALLSACDVLDRAESSSSLADAARLMEREPAQAQRLLQAVRAEILSDADYAYYLLVQARVAELNGANIAPLETSVAQAREYFERKGDAAKAAFGCYVQAKVYLAQDNPTKNLYYYQQADDWAKKTGCQLGDFPYSSIPYNIAVCHATNSYYKESLLYAEVALKYIEREDGNPKYLIYALEIKGISSKFLGSIDVSDRCYNKALILAESIQDTISANRIRYSMYALLHSGKDSAFAETKCKELLSLQTESRDSFLIGMVHLSLARIYANTNRVDSALVSIHKAEKLLQDNVLKHNRSYLKTTLLERLSSIEELKGNHANAAGYLRQLDTYKQQQEEKRKAEESQLAMLRQAKTREGEQLASYLATVAQARVYSKQSARQWIILYGMQLALALAATCLVYMHRYLSMSGKEDDTVAELCRAEIHRYAGRQSQLHKVFRSTRLCTSNEQVGRIAYMVDELVPPDDWNWRCLSPSLHCSYAELMSALRSRFPQLDETELDVYMLNCTDKLATSELASILNLEPEEVKQAEKSLSRKLRAEGYAPTKARKYVASILRG